ncbi:MAG TPA: tRNA (adenosine(37)-N6)-threonylcarbamoyltransferase complex dimerization subunit type 1 TsaB [Roseiarcus sp.]|jgi:tRNA threonylcarbamoyl adenosine modification protein YeaZ
MRILAIDTSCAACSVAAYDGQSRAVLSRRTEPMAHGHAEALGPMVEAAMAEVEGGFASLGKIAVAVGPGSFTGIRIGLAMARAMGLTLGVPVVGVSTLSAYVAPLLDDPQPGVLVSAIDARHGSVYVQIFEPTGRPASAPRVAPFREAARAIGPGPARIAGDGAAAFALEAQRAGIACEAFPAPYPDIVAIARIGLAAKPEDWPARPLYVKPPDAKPASGDAIARIEG